MLTAYFGSVLGLWDYDIPDGTETDHRAMTEAAIVERIASAPSDTVAEWRTHVRRLLDAAGDGSPLAPRVSFHGLAMAARGSSASAPTPRPSPSPR